MISPFAQVLNAGPDEVALVVEPRAGAHYKFSFSKAKAKALGEDLVRAATWPEGPTIGTLIIHSSHGELAEQYSRGGISWSEFCAKATVYRVFMLDSVAFWELNTHTGEWFMPDTTAYTVISVQVVKYKAFIFHNIRED